MNFLTKRGFDFTISQDRYITDMFAPTKGKIDKKALNKVKIIRIPNKGHLLDIQFWQIQCKLVQFLVVGACFHEFSFSVTCDG